MHPYGESHRLLHIFYTTTCKDITNTNVYSLAAGRPINAWTDIFLQQVNNKTPKESISSFIITQKFWNSCTIPWTFLILEFHILHLFFHTPICDHFSAPINYLVVTCHAQYCAILIYETFILNILLHPSISPTREVFIKNIMV